MRIRNAGILAILLFSALNTSRARAGAVSEIEEDFPVSVDSAYPLPYLGREFQSFIRYERDKDGFNKFESELRLEFGFPRNGEFKVAVPFRFGEMTPDGIRQVRAEFLYNFNQETLWVPGFSLAVGAEFPTGKEGHGVDPFGKFLFTKTLSGRSYVFRQIHVNAAYHINDDVQPGERGYEAEAFVGFSRRINSSLLFVADVGRHWTIMDRVDENLVEYGLRYQVTPLIILSGGAGHGFGDESPYLRITGGLQIMF